MSDFSLEIFAKKLRVARKSRHLTQWQLAEIMGIKRDLYAKYETAGCKLTCGFLYDISKFYGISADAFLDPAVSPEDILKKPHSDPRYPLWSRAYGAPRRMRRVCRLKSDV